MKKDHAQKLWKTYFDEWINTYERVSKINEHELARLFMVKIRREAALERALAAANRRAERAEEERDFYRTLAMSSGA